MVMPYGERLCADSVDLRKRVLLSIQQDGLNNGILNKALQTNWLSPKFNDASITLWNRNTS